MKNAQDFYAGVLFLLPGVRKTRELAFVED